MPVAASGRAGGGRLGVPPEQFAAEGGEEYELLVALPETFAPDDALAFRSATGLDLTRVGEVRTRRGRARAARRAVRWLSRASIISRRGVVDADRIASARLRRVP